jgi:transposase
VKRRGSAAPLPPKIIEKGKAGDSLAVSVVIKKYCDHEPLYRQCAEIYRETGLELSRSTLCGWVMQVGFLLKYVCLAMKRDLLEGNYIQADETTVKVQTAFKAGKNHQAYLCEYSRPGGPVVFDFGMGRSRDGPQRWLEDFEGILQCDGYGTYDQLGGPGITYAGCWAHVRRKFFEAWKVSESCGAEMILQVIGQLYAVEKEAREAALEHGPRLALRRQKSAPVVEEWRSCAIW